MTEDIVANEYSIQHYGFSGDNFFTDFSELVLEEMDLLVQHNLKLLPPMSSEIENKDILCKNFLEIHHNWSQRAGVILENLKPTINEFFKIPKNVLLAPDFLHHKQYTEEEIKNLEEQVKVLEETYAEKTKTVETCKVQIAVLEELEALRKKVDEACTAHNHFVSTVNEIKELEPLADALRKYENGDVEDDNEKNELAANESDFI